MIPRRRSCAGGLRRRSTASAPAGVALEIGFVDEHWILPVGTLGEPDGSAVAALSAGMLLWPVPADGG